MAAKTPSKTAEDAASTSARPALIRHLRNCSLSLPRVYADEAALSALDVSKSRKIVLGGKDDKGIFRDGKLMPSPEAKVSQFEAHQLMDNTLVRAAAEQGWIELVGVIGHGFNALAE